MSKTGFGANTFAHAADAASLTRASNSDRSKSPGLPKRRPVGGYAKRTLDIVLALTALAVLSPLFAMIAVLVRVSLGRPVLMAESCIGFGGRVFTVYSFRTLREHNVRRLVSRSSITRCLASLRDTRLDRLPHLVSVLRGDMSFVGPRPMALDAVKRGSACGDYYFFAKPGLVGLRSSACSARLRDRTRTALDRYYVRRWSMGLDLVLIVKAVADVR